MKRTLAWAAVGALVVLTARTVVYALSPSPLAAELSHQAGGPRLPMLVVVSLGLAVTLSAAAVWLAALGVRERQLLETRIVLTVPRLRLRLLLGRALALWLVAMPAFAYLESYIHWRQGLGWHGLHCLIGPVHRDAIPILGGLSLVAAAIAAALEHVLAWMRRALAVLAGRRRLAGIICVSRSHWLDLARPATPKAAFGARGPPPLF